MEEIVMRAAAALFVGALFGVPVCVGQVLEARRAGKLRQAPVLSSSLLESRSASVPLLLAAE